MRTTTATTTEGNTIARKKGALTNEIKTKIEPVFLSLNEICVEHG